MPSCTAALCMCVHNRILFSIDLIFAEFNFDPSTLGRTDWKFSPIENFWLYGVLEQKPPSNKRLSCLYAGSKLCHIGKRWVSNRCQVLAEGVTPLRVLMHSHWGVADSRPTPISRFPVTQQRIRPPCFRKNHVIQRGTCPTTQPSFITVTACSSCSLPSSASTTCSSPINGVHTNLYMMASDHTRLLIALSAFTCHAVNYVINKLGGRVGL